MKHRLLLSAFLSLAVAAAAHADDEVIVDDDFESYTSAAELQAVWVSTGAAGDPTGSTFLESSGDVDPDPYINYDGQVAIFDGSIGVGAGSVNQWSTAPFQIFPDETHNVELTVDLGHDALTSNKKLTMGLRYIDGGVTENIIELGYWNQLPQGPNGEFFNIAHRAILFPGGDNWQKYGLPESLDQIHEIGDGAFHRFKVTVSLDQVIFSLDLYADGLDNAASAGADYDGDGLVNGGDLLVAQRQNLDLTAFQQQYGETPVATPGVDAIDVLDASVTANGFNTLQFGIPSGQSGAGGSSADPFLGVDNVLLRRVDISGGASAAVASIPEPGSLLLGLLTIVGGTAACRRR